MDMLMDIPPLTPRCATSFKRNMSKLPIIQGTVGEVKMFITITPIFDSRLSHMSMRFDAVKSINLHK